MGQAWQVMFLYRVATAWVTRTKIPTSEGMLLFYFFFSTITYVFSTTRVIVFVSQCTPEYSSHPRFERVG